MVAAGLRSHHRIVTTLNPSNSMIRLFQKIPRPDPCVSAKQGCSREGKLQNPIPHLRCRDMSRWRAQGVSLECQQGETSHQSHIPSWLCDTPEGVWEAAQHSGISGSPEAPACGQTPLWLGQVPGSSHPWGVFPLPAVLRWTSDAQDTAEPGRMSIGK